MTILDSFCRTLRACKIRWRVFWAWAFLFPGFPHNHYRCTVRLTWGPVHAGVYVPPVSRYSTAARWLHLLSWWFLCLELLSVPSPSRRSSQRWVGKATCCGRSRTVACLFDPQKRCIFWGMELRSPSLKLLLSTYLSSTRSERKELAQKCGTLNKILSWVWVNFMMSASVPVFTSSADQVFNR